MWIFYSRCVLFEKWFFTLSFSRLPNPTAVVLWSRVNSSMKSISFAQKKKSSSFLIKWNSVDEIEREGDGKVNKFEFLITFLLSAELADFIKLSRKTLLWCCYSALSSIPLFSVCCYCCWSLLAAARAIEMENPHCLEQSTSVLIVYMKN